MNRKRSCGLDVHQDSVFAAVYEAGKPTEVKEFGTFTNQVKAMAEWMKEMEVEEVAMESTGIYWIPIWNILEESGFRLLLVNPYLVKQMPGRKRDVSDAQWIAELLHKGMLRGSMIPCKAIRSLRSYSRAYVKRQQSITRILQGIERTLLTANIRITSMASRIESKSVLEVVKLLINGETAVEKLEKKIHGRILNGKREQVRQSLEGFIQPEHRILLSQQMEEYELALKQSVVLENMMRQICESHFEEEKALLKTLPGVDEQAAMQLIAETGADMSHFGSSGKLTKWSGLCPRNDESAGKIKSKATTKGNKFIRRIIVQAAWSASRTKGSHFQTKHQQLTIRKGSKKALIAIARKMLSVIWHMLKDKTPYNPSLQPVWTPAQIAAKKKYLEKELKKLEMIEGSKKNITNK